jgi:hypothetical protein
MKEFEQQLIVDKRKINNSCNTLMLLSSSKVIFSILCLKNNKRKNEYFI